MVAGKAIAGKQALRTLPWENENYRSIVDQTPDPLDFGVCHRDASVGPVGLWMAELIGGETVRQPAYHDVVAGVGGNGGRGRSVGGPWVIDVQRQVECAMWIAPVDPVRAFGCPSV